MLKRTMDAAFFNGVANHPEVRPMLGGEGEIDLTNFASNPNNVCLQADLGGFLLGSLGVSGIVFELHTIFEPEAWGRPVLTAAKEGMEFMRALGAQIIVTFEVEGNWRSRPPKSFGWRRAGEFVHSDILGLPIRAWSLSMNDWVSSPAFKKVYH